MTTSAISGKSLFASSRYVLIPVLVLIFGLGLGIRLYDLTDLPLDFHPTRQLLSALKARGMYYQTLSDVPKWQREMAIQQWKLKATVEPPVLETIVATTYRFSGEQLWVARIYSSLFWVLGGIFLFLLARDLISIDGAVVATAFYLFLPYAVTASRSFQPDPLMITLILLFWWALSRWAKHPSWGWATLAGLGGGLAIFIKLAAVFFIIGGALGVLLSHYRIRDLAHNSQVWVMAILGALPGVIYIIYGVFVSGFLTQQFSGRFFPEMLIEPIFYVRWAGKVNLVMSPPVAMLGLLGLFFVSTRPSRIAILSLWAAYVAYGLIFNYHIASHDYYNLPLIPIVGLSLAAFADFVCVRLRQITAKGFVLRLAAAGILLYGLVAPLWDIRTEMKTTDFRPEAAYWAKIGDILGQRASLIALTEDYGSRLAYWGWQSASVWPSSGDTTYHVDLRGGHYKFERLFTKMTGKKDFFLVTDMQEFQRQPELAEHLYAGFPIYAQGDGYLIFDLRNPLNP